jgi:hypothetical protein
LRAIRTTAASGVAVHLAAVGRAPDLPGDQHSHDDFASVRSGLSADRVEAFSAWVRSGR